MHTENCHLYRQHKIYKHVYGYPFSTGHMRLLARTTRWLWCIITTWPSLPPYVHMLLLSMFHGNENLEAPDKHTGVSIHNLRSSPRGIDNPCPVSPSGHVNYNHASV